MNRQLRAARRGLTHLGIFTLALLPAQGTTRTPADSPVLQDRNETAAQHDARMAWWREAKFGMFVHWGLYAQAGGVWKGKDSPGSYKEWIMFDLIDNVAIQFAK
jgi:alpha-L-fucosidase